MQTRWFKRRPKATYTIGEKIYQGRINRHRILIRKGPEEIFDLLTDPDRFQRWCSTEELSVEKVTPGPFRVGTKFHFKLRFRIEPEWDSEVILLNRPRQIVSRFLNGIFKGGIEVWDIKPMEIGTEVTHTLLYQIHRWIYQIGWFLLGGEKKHDELTEKALSRLRSFLEEGPL